MAMFYVQCYEHYVIYLALISGSPNHLQVFILVPGLCKPFSVKALSPITVLSLIVDVCNSEQDQVLSQRSLRLDCDCKPNILALNTTNV